jgi:hypothetical protein
MFVLIHIFDIGKVISGLENFIMDVWLSYKHAGTQIGVASGGGA